MTYSSAFPRLKNRGGEGMTIKGKYNFLSDETYGKTPSERYARVGAAASAIHTEYHKQTYAPPGNRKLMRTLDFHR